MENIEDAGFEAEVMGSTEVGSSEEAALSKKGLARCKLTVSGLVFLSSATELETVIKVSPSVLHSVGALSRFQTDCAGSSKSFLLRFTRNNRSCLVLPICIHSNKNVPRGVSHIVTHFVPLSRSLCAPQALEGVQEVTVSLATGQAVVLYEAGVVSATGIAAAVQDAGFEIGEVSTGNAQSVKLSVNGVEATGEQQGGIEMIQKVLRSSLGVMDVTVEKPPGTVTPTVIVKITFDPNVTGPRTLIDTLEAVGLEEELGRRGEIWATLYDDKENTHGDGKQEREVRQLWRVFVFSLVFAVPVFLLAMVLDRIPPFSSWLMIPVVNS